jgi:hypothetical protein
LAVAGDVARMRVWNRLETAVLASESPNQVREPWAPVTNARPAQSVEQEEPAAEEHEELGRDQDGPDGHGEEDRCHDWPPQHSLEEIHLRGGAHR